ncbi:helicase-related protein [Anaeromyxobacter oryzae]|uniref:Helicase C-terminal domain-containing protein n=1 Tax=Anaeromyxobacter oryzae TaxID=2918170 RepID=A0ABM7WTK6_9BACT|nr:helicase-related protein [Anaeromyxobacter oryzae]BDG02815.1 hypothetical protein AMOR_18110 [Anaeromyxobacter oryzae]
MPSTNPPSVFAADALLRRWSAQVAPHAVHLITPVPSRTSLAKLAVPGEVRAFVARYEPRIEGGGVYSHQAQVLEALGSHRRNVVLTTATGSGKSLAFWAWAFDLLRRDPRATVIACFPTQALLWGQADRLRRSSATESLVIRSEQPFAGEIAVGETRVPWTVWYGTQNCEDMKAHEKSESFENARIRLCTLDKAHWSLMRSQHEYFLRNIAGVIVDEGHVWQGVSGAHVRRMFDRLRVALDVLQAGYPSFFVASATLPDPGRFATLLTGATGFLAIDDGTAPRHELVAASEVPARLGAAPGLEGLHRFVLMVRASSDSLRSRDLLSNVELVGREAAALCFVQNKFEGHRLTADLVRDVRERRAVAYDADMSARDRRAVEREFQRGEKGVTYVATSALEVGVDLPALDLVVMDELPARRADLLQRLGRVGRAAERPGLGVLILGGGPADLRLLDEPATLIASSSRPLGIPLHLDSLRLKAMKACFGEHERRARSASIRGRLTASLERHFGEGIGESALDQRIADELSGLVELDDGAWVYKGFRTSASQGKIPLVLEASGKEVARIQDIAVFRDAHPEAVYLGHKGERFRILRYEGEFQVGEWRHPDSPVVLGKFMHQLRAVIVEQISERVATRGCWEDRFDLHTPKDLPPSGIAPATGALEYGIWDFLRHFDGYNEIELATGRTKRVKLADVSKRFKEAVQRGASFPFLHDFTYRTLGWQWHLARVLPEVEVRTRAAPMLSRLLHAWFCDAVECAPGDLEVELDPLEPALRVVDTTPGGNGLSAALLDDRIAAALAAARRAVAAESARGAEAFSKWITGELGVDPEASPKEIDDALQRLESPWRSERPRASTG